MNKLWKLVPWITRLVLVPPTVVLSTIGACYLIHPVYSAALQGTTFCINLGLTTARILLGGFPLGFALFLAICLFSRRRVLVGLVFTSVLMGVVLLVRVCGVYGISTVAEYLKLVRVELVLLFLSGFGVLLELGRRSHIEKMITELAAEANWNTR